MNIAQHKMTVVHNDNLRVIRKLEGSKKSNGFKIDASSLIRECMKASK